MKKSLKIVLMMMLIMVLSIYTNSLAASGTAAANVTLTPSKTEVKPDEEFTVVISQECSDGIIGIEAQLEYDTNIFELKNTALNQSWSNLGEGTKLEAMSNDDIKSGDIFTLTFATKSNATKTTSPIKLTGIKVYKTYDEIAEVEDKSISINVAEKSSGSNDNENNDNNNDNNNQQQVLLSKIEITKAPNTTQYTEGEKFNPSGMIIQAIYSNETKKEITNYTYSPNGALKKENKLITFSYQENGVTKTATQAITVKAAASNNNNNNNNSQNNNNQTHNTTNNTTNNTATKNVTNNTTNTGTTTASQLPKTGARTKYILVVVIGLLGVGFISYIGYRKYKEI